MPFETKNKEVKREVDHKEEPKIESTKKEEPKATEVSKKVEDTKKPEPHIPSKTQTVKVASQPKQKHELAVKSEKNKDFGTWYKQTLTKSDMIDYYDVSGCYIIKPYSYSIWERIQERLNKEIKAQGVQNAYFPLLVTREALSKEEKHLEGFKAEVAWVTHSAKEEITKEEPAKEEETDVNELVKEDNEPKIAIRPTSESIIYPAYSKWIRSYRDLPVKLNQWSNVVRWEFTDSTPFIRSREFLWQEGHTAHASEEEAKEMTQKMLDIYHNVYEDLLALPSIKGEKSINERFAGADQTFTVELLNDANGKGIQGATSHYLGKNFSDIYDISYEDEHSKINSVFQTCWGFTWRSIGAMIMIHGDDKGLVLPPKVAEYQVVIVPIYKSHEDKSKINDKIDEITKVFERKNIRYHIDSRENLTPGYKFNHWEQKGVPVRLEVGANDLKNGSAAI